MGTSDLDGVCQKCGKILQHISDNSCKMCKKIDKQKDNESYEYLGIYDEEYIKLHVIKIRAETKEEAIDKFHEYTLNHLKIRDRLDKDRMYVIPLKGLEVI